MNKKISIAYITPTFIKNGISMVILNYCKYLDKDKFQIDVISGDDINEENAKLLNEYGVNLIRLNCSKYEKSSAYYKALKKTLNKKQYDIVHIHGNSAVILIETLIAKKAQAKKIVVHSHNTTCDHKVMHKLLKSILNKKIDYRVSCSKMAGEWLFNNDFTVIDNGIDINKFYFNSDLRNKYRKELKVNDDEIILGHVGRFNEQKNQLFLIKCFEKAKEKNSKLKLLLIGTGPDFFDIKNYVDNSKYKNDIILYGESSDVNELYNAMDYFVFPSKYEGLGIVLIEAQINNLKCIASSVIPDDAIISDSFIKLDLEEIKWTKKIESLELYNRNEEIVDKDSKNKFNIKSVVNKLGDIYEKLVK